MTDDRAIPVEQRLYTRPPVEVSFKSYAKGLEQDDGYEVTVTSDASKEDVDATVSNAARARVLARFAITAGMDVVDNDLVYLLEQSVDKLRAVQEASADKPGEEWPQP